MLTRRSKFNVLTLNVKFLFRNLTFLLPVSPFSTEPTLTHTLLLIHSWITSIIIGPNILSFAGGTALQQFMRMACATSLGALWRIACFSLVKPRVWLPVLLSTLPWKLDYEPPEKFAVPPLVLLQSDLCQENEQSMTVEWSYVHNKGESGCFFYIVLSWKILCLEDFEADTVVYLKFKNGRFGTRLVTRDTRSHAHSWSGLYRLC